MRLIEHADPSALVAALAVELGRITDAALAERGRAVLVLAGGRTPMPVYRAWAAQARDWSRVIVLPSDERWVDAGHPARNDEEIADALAGAVGIELRALVPARAELPPGAACAQRALADLLEPFDAVLLGMGLDAHTASLFPHGEGTIEAMGEDARADAFVVTPRPLPAEAPYPRISLGRRRLLHARRLLLALTGAGKREVLQRVQAQPDPLQYPIAALLAPALDMTIHWSP